MDINYVKNYKLWQVFAHEYGHASDFINKRPINNWWRIIGINPVERSAEAKANILRRLYGIPENSRYFFF